MRAAAVLVAIASLARAADLPSTLVSDDEAEPIHSAILRGEAWTRDAVRHLRSDADRRVKEGPWSVASDRPKGLDLDPHEYYSESASWWPNPEDPAGPYIRREGQFNPDRFTANRIALTAMSDAVFTLGSAAFLLNDPHYAQRAARLVQTWFVNPKTRMNPNMEHAQSIPGPPPIVPPGLAVPPYPPQAPLPSETRSLIRLIQGLEFLARSGEWDLKDQAAVHKWFDDYLHWLAPSQVAADRRTANERAWWAAETAAVATFVADPAATQRAFGFYRDRIFPREIRAQAAVRGGTPRGSSELLAADLEAIAIVCRIAQVRGAGLWDVKSRNGTTIAAAFDALVSSLSETKKTVKNQAPALEPGGVYLLAFAGMGLNQPDYIALFRNLERGDSAWLAMVDLLVGHWEAAGHQTRH